jgi:hypothetical protein
VRKIRREDRGCEFDELAGQKRVQGVGSKAVEILARPWSVGRIHPSQPGQAH